MSESVIAGDLAALVIALEPLQEQAIRGALQSDDVSDGPLLTEAEEAAGLALLRDPLLPERIVADVEAIGVVGEGTNALVGYLAMVSRLLDKPLAILIQSTSAAGKSTLMDALLSLMPESDRVHYSAMTGQSLFLHRRGRLAAQDPRHRRGRRRATGSVCVEAAAEPGRTDHCQHRQRPDDGEAGHIGVSRRRPGDAVPDHDRDRTSTRNS